MFVVDEAGRPLAVGDQVLRRLGDEPVTHEMGAFKFAFAERNFYRG